MLEPELKLYFLNYAYDVFLKKEIFTFPILGLLPMTKNTNSSVSKKSTTAILLTYHQCKDFLVIISVTGKIRIKTVKFYF